ncbi:hypothetical protein NKH18_31270 [Streptomyces sp. M10(2022)]
MSGTQIDYTPDNGAHSIRISLDPAPDFATRSRTCRASRRTLPGGCPDTSGRCCTRTPSATGPALWEFSWVESKDHLGPRHGIDQMYYAEAGGPEYALYMTGPESDWDVSRERFETMLRSWQPPGDTG